MVYWYDEAVQNTSHWEVLHDRILLNIYQKGDAEQRNRAFDVIYHRYETEVANYVEKKVKEESRAKEVFSDVWVKASEKFKTFAWQGISLNHWLIKVAKYTILDSYRKDKKRQKLEILTDFTDSAADRIKNTQTEPNFVIEELLRKEGHQRFLQIIKFLKNDLQRQILILCYFNELTFNEIALQLGQSAGSIRVNHSRALKKLAKHFAKA